MSKPVVACPAEMPCEAKLSLLAGSIASHLIDEHSYSQVGAKAAENVVRRETLRGSTILTPDQFIDHVIRQTGPNPTYRVRRLCGICRQPGHRRETCGRQGTVAGSPEKASPESTSPESTSPGDSPLLRVGRAIDLLREAADELDQLVAAGIIA